MPSAFTIDIKLETNIPDFVDANIPLKQIANKVVQESRKNIRKQEHYDGGAFDPLAEKTIQDKIREGASNPRRALYRKGIMYRAIHAYKLRHNAFVVGVIPRGKPPRDLVALIQQEQGVNQHTRIARRFLGMSSKTIAWANARLYRWVNERAQKSAKKMFNFKY